MKYKRWFYFHYGYDFNRDVRHRLFIGIWGPPEDELVEGDMVPYRFEIDWYPRGLRREYYIYPVPSVGNVHYSYNWTGR